MLLVRNDFWAMDFVHDQLAASRKLRILIIIDTHSRYCLAIDSRFIIAARIWRRHSNI
jgi:transposase InsO family protein